MLSLYEIDWSQRSQIRKCILSSKKEDILSFCSFASNEEKRGLLDAGILHFYQTPEMISALLVSSFSLSYLSEKEIEEERKRNAIDLEIDTFCETTKMFLFLLSHDIHLTKKGWEKVNSLIISSLSSEEKKRGKKEYERNEFLTLYQIAKRKNMKIPVLSTDNEVMRLLQNNKM